MAKYITNTNGTLTEAETGLLGGATDANKIPNLDANGKLTEAMMPTGVGRDVNTIVTSESLSAGDFVNVWNDGGVTKVRKADCTGANASKKAHGFVLAAFNHPTTAEVYFEGTNTGVSGLTGGDVFLAATAGQATNTVPTTSTYTVQRIGVAVSATAINFEKGEAIVLV